MSEIFHTKYRPTTFSDVVGQDAVVKSLEHLIDNYESQCFLFSGPAGTGKTTLSRICANEIGCSKKDVMEIDGATFTGIDQMRQVQKSIQYRPFGKGDARAVIVDEAHRLSKNAWDSILKVTEEPPEHVYWFLCTTEPSKVPATIKSRFSAFNLKSVDEKNLGTIVDRVCDFESIDLDETVRDCVIKEANGSPRQALNNLALVYDLSSKKEAMAVLGSAQDSEPVRELCQFLLKPGSWTKAMSIVAKLKDENPESVRIVVCRYMASAAKGAKSEKSVIAALTILDSFSQPFNQSEDIAPLLLAIGRVLYADD